MTALPDFLLDRPKAHGDVLDGVFAAVRLTGAVFFDVQAASPWVAAAPAAREIAHKVMPGAEHVMEFHAITGGPCWGGIVGKPAVRLEDGDFILFPRGDPHIIGSDPALHAEPDPVAYGAMDQPRPFVLRAGTGTPDTRLVCGFLACDVRPFNPLLAALPRVFHLRAQSAAQPTLKSLVALAVRESSAPRAATDTVLAKLSELMFVEALREYVSAHPSGDVGWLAALADPVIGRAISFLHQHPAQGWTLDDLARALGVSRSVLAARFTELVGVPPMQYLLNWRMQLASHELRQNTGTVATIGESVGYASEAAFSRAFKKVVGTSPATWRRGLQKSSRLSSLPSA